jgi:hypothetical protein
MRLLLTFIVLTFTAVCVYASRAQTTQDTIKQIRSVVQKINSDQSFKTIKLENDDFLPETDGGNSLTAYYKKDTIYKMSVWAGLSYCIREYDYYFSEGKPIFIYEREEDFPETKSGSLDYNKVNLAFEGRYYLNAGKVIDIKLKGKKRMDERPTAISIQSLVADAASYEKLLYSHFKKRK